MKEVRFNLITNQKKFLTNMGILAKSRNNQQKYSIFSQKADLFYRVRRLIDEKQMGELFKVMLVIKVKRNNFKTGFQN